jgi:D-3-phosphoglycerate dehydrogenase
LTTIAIIDPGAAPTAEAARRLRALGHSLDLVGSRAAAGATVLLAGGFAVVDDELLNQLPAVEVVVRPGAGFERVEVDALRRRGVRLVAARLAADPAVAEWVIGAAIHLLRKFDDAGVAARAGDWGARPGLAGRSLGALTLGIVGMGRIGSQVAALGRAFGMRVIAWHPWSDRDLGAGIDRTQSLDELLSTADVVTLHCRLTEETAGLIGSSQLNRMKRDAIFINTGRGGLIDEAALAAALSGGRIAGAAIDTVEAEPHTELSPLARSERVLFTPHMSGWTLDSVEALAAWGTAAVLGYLADRSLPADGVIV